MGLGVAGVLQLAVGVLSGIQRPVVEQRYGTDIKARRHDMTTTMPTYINDIAGDVAGYLTIDYGHTIILDGIDTRQTVLGVPGFGFPYRTGFDAAGVAQRELLARLLLA
jgi:hypothetical protein